jgi:hypothetical protein
VCRKGDGLEVQEVQPAPKPRGGLEGSEHEVAEGFQPMGWRWLGNWGSLLESSTAESWSKLDKPHEGDMHGDIFWADHVVHCIRSEDVSLWH